MHLKPWEIAAAAIFLTICLLGGLALATWMVPEPVIGLIRFEGAIDIGSSAALNEVIDAARVDDSVQGVVLEILSPGGLATSSESVFYSLLQLREVKPVIVVVDGLAASGGFYIAAAGNRIYAPASSYVGNIGTRGPRPQDPAISPEEISSGPFKLSGGNRFDRIQQLALVRDAFVGNVVHQRSLAEVNPLNVDAETVAEGRIYMGSEAVAIGLVDYEGSRSDAIVAAASLAGLDNYRTVDLVGYLGFYSDEPEQPTEGYSVHSMVERAPPDAIFLLDSRIPLPGSLEGTELDRHLLKLRNIDAASLGPIQSRFGAAFGERIESLTPRGE